MSDEGPEATTLARELETLNARRQELDQRILDEALELAEATLAPEDRALVLAADGWHPGVIGIVASRLVERYGRPTFLIGWDEAGDSGRGSGRSIVGFDLHAALHRVDRKSTRLNSSHSQISYAVFCLKKKNPQTAITPYRVCQAIIRARGLSEYCTRPPTPLNRSTSPT